MGTGGLLSSSSTIPDSGIAFSASLTDMGKKSWARETSYMRVTFISSV